MKEEKNYKYDAFISYRHCDLDKYVAENLHKALETYELPKNVKEKLGITGRTIKRVFRDQDELPLSSNLEDPIVDALNNSKYLIVICSPRLKDSMWCQKEIETFKKLRGRKNIFCVLIEGEPKDSFPEEVTYDIVETKDKNGKVKKEKKPVEPLAADVRGIDKKDVLRRIKEEKLRLIAPMYNLDYDDLKQRHRLRKMRKIIYASVLIATFSVLFTIYSLAMLLKISSQQKTLKLHQANTLSEKAITYLNNDSRHKAIESSYNALTKFNGVKMPYTSDAEYALCESLGVYDAGLSYKALNELKTKGVVDYLEESSDSKYAISYDESEELIIWDLDNLKKVKTFSDIYGFGFTDEKYTFVGTSKMAYINKNGSAIIADLKTGKVLKEIKKNEYSYQSIRSDSEGNFIALNDSPNLYLYDVNDNYSKVGSYKVRNTIASELRFSLDGKYLFAASSDNSFDFYKADKLQMHVLNTSNLEEVNTFSINSRYLEGITEKDDNVYILSNQSIGNDMTMVITSYNYKNNKVNWTKEFDGVWGKMISRSLADGVNNLAVAHSNVVEILSMTSGDVIQSFSLNADVIGMYVSLDQDMYIAFTSDGNANFLNMKYKEAIINRSLFILNLDEYKTVVKSNSGYLFAPNNENRIIYYAKKSSKELKELKDKKYELPKSKSVSPTDYDKIRKDYNLKKKNLVNRIIYDDNKEYLFVSYTDSTLGIYEVKSKKFIKMVEGTQDIEYYYGKDKDNRIYVGNLSNSYILDKDFNKVGHINNLVKLDSKNNKVIIIHSDKYYSIPIYDLDDLLKQAKDYLNK